MRGGPFGREEGGAPLAEPDPVFAAPAKAGQVGVGGANARLFFVLAGSRPDLARTGGRAAAVLRMEGRYHWQWVASQRWRKLTRSPPAQGEARTRKQV